MSGVCWVRWCDPLKMQPAGSERVRECLALVLLVLLVLLVRRCLALVRRCLALVRPW